MLKKLFFDTHKFPKQDNNAFILLLWKYVNDLEKFNETSSEKEDFYDPLNMEDITDPDYAHGQTACIDFKIKHLGQCQDLYVQSNTLLLPNVFENFLNMCLETWTWTCLCFYCTKVRLDYLTAIDMLSVIEKDIRGEICHAICWYAKASDKYMKDYDKYKES